MRLLILPAFEKRGKRKENEKVHLHVHSIGSSIWQKLDAPLPYFNKKEKKKKKFGLQRLGRKAEMGSAKRRERDPSTG